MIKIWSCFLICLSTTFCLAQRELLDELVTVNYNNIVLEAALLDISEKYDFSFAYSKDMVSLDTKISIHAETQPLGTILDEFFQNTAIKYTQIGNQIVLKFDQTEFGLISQRRKRKKRKRKNEKITIIRKIERANEKIDVPPSMEGLPMKRIVFVPRVIYVDEKLKLPKVVPMKLDTRPSIEELQDKDAKVVVAITPTISSDRIFQTDSVVNLSLNLISGSVSNVEGAQIGTFSNRIEGDLKGVQVGLGINRVGNDMLGTQISLIRNSTKGKGYGAQLTLGVNRIENINGAQIALLSNKASKDANIQIAVLRNKAENTNLQIGLFNRSKEKANIQIGLINRCDTISGVGIALFNFVRHGNNYFEYSLSPVLKHNFALKFGGHRLYNILKHSRDKEKGIRTFGYGMGNTRKLSEYWRIDLELIGQYLLKEGNNDLELNLLNNLNLNMDLKMFSWAHLFGGLRLNTTILETKIENTEEYKYKIAPKNIIFSDKIGKINQYDVKSWLDYQFGIRFYMSS